MNKTFTSWSALKSALQNEVYSAMEETIDKSLLDARDNVDYFYNSPVGAYQRTGQLGNSPESSLTGSGESVSGEISLNTAIQYDPSGRDTQTIYGYAESGELLGNGGFWEKTVDDIHQNIQDAFGKRFK